ncbi:MAG: hypothetical protein Q4E54_04805 [Lachnospiraceae bacterium]|nr:hypothetical protein [Lachnospiraceae bacterium]
MKTLKTKLSLLLAVAMLMTSTFSAFAAEKPIEDGAVETKTETDFYQADDSEELIEEPTEEPEEESATPSYTVTWKNDDGKVLKTDKDVPEGTVPEYTGTTPTKKADAQFTYNFDKWYPEVTEVTEDVTYTATYTEELNHYTVTWVDWDGTELEKDEDVPYGATPSYEGQTPFREEDAQYIYTFDKWSPDITTVSKNVTYKATYTGTLQKYDVVWKNWDGEILKTDKDVEYGSVPIYDADGAVPTRPADGENTYSFLDWEPVLAYVTGDAEYTAKYKTISRYVNITFNPSGGTFVSGETPEEGSDVYVLKLERNSSGFASIGDKMPVVERNNYEFDGWRRLENGKVVDGNVFFNEDVELVAYWNEVPHQVNFYTDEDATVLWATPSTTESNWKISMDDFPKDPVKEGYAFDGWVIKGTKTKVTVDSSFPEDTDVVPTWIKTHIIHVICGEHGSVTPSGDFEIKEGSVQRFSFDPDEDYEVDKIFINGDKFPLPTDYYYTFSNVTEDQTLEVVFKGREFTIQAGDGLTPSGSVKVRMGESITFTYNKNNVKYLLVDAVRDENVTGSYTFENVTRVHTISLVKKSSGGSSGGSSGSSVGGGVATTTTYTAAKQYSDNWFVDTNGAWKIRNSAGNIVVNSWICDNDVIANGNDVWYIVGADGSMVAANLVRDKNGYYYSFETDSTNRKYGMMRNKSGYYKCGDLRIYLQISDQHDATYGRILNQDSINKLIQTFGVVDYPIGNENCVYTATF